jgi:hypothetical protein
MVLVLNETKHFIRSQDLYVYSVNFINKWNLSLLGSLMSPKGDLGEEALKPQEVEYFYEEIIILIEVISIEEEEEVKAE